MTLACRTATRKNHRCDTCGREIPVGAKYWWDPDADVGGTREHTNCEDFKRSPALPDGYNQNRPRVKR